MQTYGPIYNNIVPLNLQFNKKEHKLEFYSVAQFIPFNTLQNSWISGIIQYRLSQVTSWWRSKYHSVTYNNRLTDKSPDNDTL